MDTARKIGERLGEPPSPTEDEFTKSIERYTAGIPSSTFLAVGIGAVALALLAQISGRGKWGNFVAQWVPTVLIMGVYNKLVKLEGHDQADRGQGNTGRAGHSQKPLSPAHTP